METLLLVRCSVILRSEELHLRIPIWRVRWTIVIRSWKLNGPCNRSWVGANLASLNSPATRSRTSPDSPRISDFGLATPTTAAALTVTGQTRVTVAWADFGFPRRSFDERQSMRNRVREDIGIQHDDDGHDGTQGNRVPDNEAEDDPFIPNLCGSRCSNCDRLRVDHFAHDATGAVGGTHEHGIYPELLRCDPLQASEQRIGRRVAARERDAEPAEKRAKEWVKPAGAGEGESQNGVQT